MSRKPKLNPNIVKFVTDTRKRNKEYGVRQLSELVKKRFNVYIGKSSINNILKTSHLSRPVGRSVLKTNRFSGELYGAGYFFILGALRSYEICEKIAVLIKESNASEEKAEVLVSMVEALILAKAVYNVPVSRIVEYSKEELWNILGYKISKGNIQNFLNTLNYSQAIANKLVTEYLLTIKDVHHIRFQLADGSIIYLDGSLNAVWPTAKIPIEFSTTSFITNRYVDLALDGKEPFFVFNSLGISSLEKEISNLIYCLDGAIASKRIRKVGFFKPSGEFVKESPLVLPQRRRFVIGVWPSQFKAISVIEKKKPVSRFYFDPLGKSFVVTEEVVKYSQHIENNEVKLRVIVLKNDEMSSTRLAFLTNLDASDWPAQEVAEAFLRRFGDFEKKQQFFQKKVQNPGYLENFLSFEKIGAFSLRLKQNQDFDQFLTQIVETSDLLAKSMFFPPICNNWSLLKTRELIYKGSGFIKRDLSNDSLLNFNKDNELWKNEFYEQAFVNFNQSLIFEKSGRKIWFLFPPVFS